jgi:hypothetical protein
MAQKVNNMSFQTFALYITANNLLMHIATTTNTKISKGQREICFEQRLM